MCPTTRSPAKHVLNPGPWSYHHVHCPPSSMSTQNLPAAWSLVYGALTGIVLIWKTAPGSSLVSAWTVALMPMAASAPRTTPQGNQRNWGRSVNQDSERSGNGEGHGGDDVQVVLWLPPGRRSQCSCAQRGGRRCRLGRRRPGYHGQPGDWRGMGRR